MKKCLVTISAISLFSGAVYAQSSVTLSGSVYAGLGLTTSATGASTTALAGTSSWMLSGREDLGDGNAAIFKLESGFNLDTGASANATTLFDKQAFVGLQGKWGTVRAGRLYTPAFATLALVADPSGTYSLLSSTNLMESSGVRLNNGIIYNSPGFNPWTYARDGFYGAAAYYMGEVAGSSSTNGSLGLNVGYGKGPLVVELSNHKSNATSTTAPITSIDTNNTLLAANYNFNLAKVFFAYAWNSANNAATSVKTKDNTDLLLGVTAPVGPGTLTASYIVKDDKLAANADAVQYGVTYHYPLSKRTRLLAGWAKINHTNAPKYVLSAGYTGSTTGTTGFITGIAHAF